MSSQDFLSSIRSRASLALSTLPSPAFKYGLDIQSSPLGWDWSKISQTQESAKGFSHHHVHESGVLVVDFIRAASEYHSILSKVGSLLNEGAPLAQLHLSKIENGLLVYIPAHTRSSSPMVLPPLPFVYSHILVVAEPHSSVTLILPETAVPHASFQSSVVEVVASSHSKVSIVSQQNLSTACVHSSFKRARVENHASVDWFWVEHGSSFTKLEVSSDLVGENASSQNFGVLAASGEQVFDVSQSAVHLFPSSKSHLVTRGVLDDSAKCVYSGLLKMTKDAKGSVGNQRADFLLLSPKSEADPVPALEIEGSDVRCAHAATVGRLDKEKLFYLSSRGLSDEVARAIYIQGFLEHVLHQFPLHDSMDTIRSCLAQSLDLSSHGISPASHEELVA